MAPASDYSTPLPCAGITAAQGINDKLALTRYSANHAPSGQAAATGRLAMFVRAFDRNGGKPLPADWRSTLVR